MSYRRILPVVKSFFGSLLVMLFGAAMVFSGLRNYPFAMDTLVGGIAMILAAAAYRSAKQRRIGWKPNTKLRRAVEYVLLGLALLPGVILAFEGLEAMLFNPWSGIIVPAGSIAAFVWILTRKNLDTRDAMPSIR